MIIDMFEEMAKDIEEEKKTSASIPSDPAADEMRKLMEESNKKMAELQKKIEALGEKPDESIENENENKTENESEENKNEDQDA